MTFRLLVLICLDLADAEAKGGEVFVAQAQHASQNPRQAQVIRHYGDSLVAIGALRHTYVSSQILPAHLLANLHRGLERTMERMGE